ncbi:MULTISPECIES: YacL family protein [Aeromonas]|uniref:YacL family protein n=1 Tax=Aeromonas TaxID=642 RepID=UPI000379930B|nr:MULTISPECIES: YacL family protein [Aeromonas]QSR42007.1 YacL family protein [Aeromonas dhakensis]QXC07220.1 YacL family protein [Aeromonas sp. FDAARGOS 1408]HDX8365293.1 YacL family protein [Aeromonas dhakensis]HDX9011588.1 YacL family protein [Aeromonas dhakensis]HDZ8926475.1 YacL family protein [Aeromonas dhakensis]
MDYEFRRDPFGGYRARFSMGHEAIGQWLIDEVGKDEEKLDELFAIIDQLSSRTRTEYRLLGGDYSLLLTHEEAEVKANVLNIEQDEDLDDLAYYDDEQLAMCGLEDFAQVLVSWRAFIRNEDMG